MFHTLPMKNSETDLEKVLAKIAKMLGQKFCGLVSFGKHDRLLHFEAERVTMRCSNCGHDSPGWDIPQPRWRKVIP
jgi:hypothetical protein